MALRTVTLTVTITAPAEAFEPGVSSEDITDDLIQALSQSTHVEVA